MKILSASILTATALCAFVALAGCSTSSNGSGAQTNPSYAAPQQGMRAPLVLRLRGPDPIPAAGDIKVDVEILVNEPIKVPVFFQVQTPPGVQLLSGAPSETLSLPQAGTLMRTFVVRTNAPMQNPIIVTAQANDPNGAFGFRAERRFPAPVAAPIAPGGHGPPVPRPGQPPR